MADDDLKAELERLRTENESLKKVRRGSAVSMKVSEKGAVSVYGLGRFPGDALSGAVGEAALDGRGNQNVYRREQE